MSKFIYLVKNTKEILKKYDYPNDKRTLIQKVLYFSAGKELRGKLFVPYLYGPYSSDIQLAIIANEKENSPWNCKGGILQEEWLKRTEKALKFFKRNELTKLKDIANLSKVHYLTVQKEISDIEKIKNVSRLLSWLEIYKINEKKIEELVTLAKKIEEDVYT